MTLWLIEALHHVSSKENTFLGEYDDGGDVSGMVKDAIFRAKSKKKLLFFLQTASNLGFPSVSKILGRLNVVIPHYPLNN